jgi:hypothetical protein
MKMVTMTMTANAASLAPLKASFYLHELKQRPPIEDDALLSSDSHLLTYLHLYPCYHGQHFQHQQQHQNHLNQPQDGASDAAAGYAD